MGVSHPPVSRRSVGNTSKQPYFHLSACRRSSRAGIQSAIQGEWVFTRRIEDCAKPKAPGVSQAAPPAKIIVVDQAGSDIQVRVIPNSASRPPLTGSGGTMRLIPHHQDASHGRPEYRSPDGTWRVVRTRQPGRNGNERARWEVHERPEAHAPRHCHAASSVGETRWSSWAPRPWCPGASARPPRPRSGTRPPNAEMSRPGPARPGSQ